MEQLCLAIPAERLTLDQAERFLKDALARNWLLSAVCIQNVTAHMSGSNSRHDTAYLLGSVKHHY